MNRELKYAAMVDLEGPINDMVMMAGVAAQILSDALGESHEEVTKNRDMYFLPKDQVSQLIFCAGHVAHLAGELQRAFDEIAAGNLTCAQLMAARMSAEVWSRTEAEQPAGQRMAAE
jgi:hypothetical protein